METFFDVEMEERDLVRHVRASVGTRRSRRPSFCSPHLNGRLCSQCSSLSNTNLSLALFPLISITKHGHPHLGRQMDYLDRTGDNTSSSSGWRAPGDLLCLFPKLISFLVVSGLASGFTKGKV